ncbi:MAG: PIN domain-containing protein [bacterium]
MVYADTDFFLATMKKKDWLKSNAKKLYKKYGKSLWTSVVTLTEILLLCQRYDLDPEKVTISLFSICRISGIEKETALQAAYYMQHHKLNVFDAFHAAFSANDEIISSDKIFDMLGIKRIKLE